MDEKRDIEIGQNVAPELPAYEVGSSSQQVPHPGYASQPPSYPGSYGAPPVNTAYGAPQPGQTAYVTQVTTTHTSSFDDMKGAIPIMPLWFAIICFFFNCILPGFGTIMGSFSVFCCADIGKKAGSRFGTFCLNFWIGWMQLLTLFIFLIGWFWSIMWGWLFVAYSLEFYGKEPTTTVVTRTAVPMQQPPPPGYTTTQQTTTTYQGNYPQ